MCEMDESKKAEEMDEILQKHGYEAINIIAILHDTQAKYRYVPREVFPYLSKKLGISTAKIYSVATFYENFSLEPKGKYVF
jgi:NADH-quinone oxidoreductase subunit E